jgi:hypothetical protein
VQLDNDDFPLLQSSNERATRLYAARGSGESSLRPMTRAAAFASIAAMRAQAWLPVHGPNDRDGP